MSTVNFFFFENKHLKDCSVTAWRVTLTYWTLTASINNIITTCLGAMVAICDLNEYRSCTKPLGPLVQELFETLHALCNLLLVKPENLQQVCSEDSLVSFFCIIRKFCKKCILF